MYVPNVLITCPERNSISGRSICGGKEQLEKAGRLIEAYIDGVHSVGGDQAFTTALVDLRHIPFG